MVCVVVFLQAYIDYVKELKFRQLNGIKDNYMVRLCATERCTRSRRGRYGGEALRRAKYMSDKVLPAGIFVEGSSSRPTRQR